MIASMPAGGACADVDPEVFYQRSGHYPARRVCAMQCPVRPECLLWIMRLERGWRRADRSGIVAGLDGLQRQRLDLKLTDEGGRLRWPAPPSPRPACGTPEALLLHLERAERLTCRCWAAEADRDRTATTARARTAARRAAA